MSSVQSIIIAPEPVRTITSGALTINYQAVGGPLLDSSHMVIFQNGTNGNVMISWDGINDHYPVFSGAFVLLDVATNRTHQAGAFLIPTNTQFWAKWIAVPGGPTGSVYITSFYGA